MTHDQIEKRDMIDGYLRGRLAEDDRKAFEEHFFGCDECFDEVQTAQRMACGVRAAVETGLLPAVQEKRAGWWMPVFALSAVAAGLLLAVTTWMTLVEVPRMRTETA